MQPLPSTRSPYTYTHILPPFPNTPFPPLCHMIGHHQIFFIPSTRCPSSGRDKVKHLSRPLFEKWSLQRQIIEHVGKAKFDQVFAICRGLGSRMYCQGGWLCTVLTFSLLPVIASLYLCTCTQHPPNLSPTSPSLILFTSCFFYPTIERTKCARWMRGHWQRVALCIDLRTRAIKVNDRVYCKLTPPPPPPTTTTTTATVTTPAVIMIVLVLTPVPLPVKRVSLQQHPLPHPHHRLRSLHCKALNIDHLWISFNTVSSRLICNGSSHMLYVSMPGYLSIPFFPFLV